MVSQPVLEFRDHFRATSVPRYYSGLAHLAFTSLVSLGVILFAASRVRRVTGWELLVIPATFLLSNYVEYRGHRGPMHHPVSPLRMIFERHTLEHHHLFTHDAMACERINDLKRVLFPPVMIFFFLGLHAVPVVLLLYFLVSPNVAYLNIAAGIGYFLTYEWLHLCHHLPEDVWAARLPLMRVLRRHHAVHHNPALMNHHNFNITFPICGLEPSF